MLRGLRHPGSAFQQDADGHGYTVVPGVHVGHLSPTCLRKLLQRFAEAGNMALMCALPPCLWSTLLYLNRSSSLACTAEGD